MVLTYKVKIEEYRQQATNKERRQTPHYNVRLVFIFSSQKLPLKRLEILWFYCLAGEIMSCVCTSLWEYNDFCLESFDSSKCLSELRANKEDLPRLST